MRHRWGLYCSRRAKRTSAVADAHDLTPVSVEDLDIEVSVCGLVADVRCRARYRNNETYDADCVFLFALDRKSAMYGFEATSAGGRVVVGRCVARSEDDDELPRRHVKFDESSAADMFSCGAGLLASKESAIVEFQYATELAVAEDGGVKFVFPTFVPRAYQKNFAAASAELFGFTANISCRFKAAIAGSYLIDEIFCRELLEVQYVAGSRYHAKIALVNGHDVASDIEFTITYKDMHLPHIHIESPFSSSAASDYYIMQRPVAAFTFYNRVRKALSSSSKGEYIIAIDRSASMRGFKMQNARETLLYFLKSLPHGCYFNVVSFGSTFQPLFPRSRIYNQHNVRLALRLQMKMTADLLGTEILPMLRYLVELPAIEQHTRQVFLLTDGAVSNTQEVLEYMWEKSASGNGTRIFTFGIGESASRPLLLGLSRAGNGRCHFLKSNERPYTKVLSALRNAMQPCLTDLDVHFTVPEGVEIHVMAPGVAGTLFAEESLTIYCLVTGLPVDEDCDDTDTRCVATLAGKLEGQPFSSSVHFNLSELSRNDTLPIHRLAIKAAMLDMERGVRQALGAEDILENEYEILVASQASNVASAQYTRHIGIDSSTGQPAEMLDIVPVCADDASLRMSASGIDLHFTETSSVYRSRSRLSLPRTEAGLRSFVKSIFPSSTSSWSLQGGQRQSQTAPTRNRPTLADIDEELAISQVDLSCSNTDDWNKFKATLLEPQGVTQFQLADGSWPLSRELAYALGTTEESLRRNNPLRSGTAWATVICLEWLGRHFSERKFEWSERQTNALRWLRGSAELEGYELSELSEMALSVVKSSCHLRTDVDDRLPPSSSPSSSSPPSSRRAGPSCGYGSGSNSASSTLRRYQHRPCGGDSLDGLDADSFNEDSLDTVSNAYDGESLYRYEIFNLMETHLSDSRRGGSDAGAPAASLSAAVRTSGGASDPPVTVAGGRPDSIGSGSGPQASAAPVPKRRASANADDSRGGGSRAAVTQSQLPAAVSRSRPESSSTIAEAPKASGRPVPAARQTAADSRATTSTMDARRSVTGLQQADGADAKFSTATAGNRTSSTASRDAVERPRSLSSTTFSYRSAQSHSVYGGTSRGSDGPEEPSATSYASASSSSRRSSTSASGLTGSGIRTSDAASSTSPTSDATADGSGSSWKKKFSVLFERSGRFPKTAAAVPIATPSVIAATSAAGRPSLAPNSGLATSLPTSQNSHASGGLGSVGRRTASAAEPSPLLAAPRQPPSPRVIGARQRSSAGSLAAMAPAAAVETMV